MKTRRLYQFGPFSLDATAKVLLKDGQPVHLTRKAVETLLALVENPDQVVTREELMASVWPDRVVDDANLAQNIAVVRKALAAEPGAPGHIETFPGRGYRVLGPIHISEQHPEQPDMASHAGRRWRPWFAAVVAAVLIAAAAVWIWRRKPAASVAEEPRRVPVTRLAGKEYQPELSPDGRTVIFVWEREGAASASIWMQEADENTPRPVSGSDAHYSSPAWSPDGRRIAFLKFKQSSGSIIVASRDGGDRRVIAPASPFRHGLPQRHLDWSPDGRTLVVDDADSDREAFGIFLVSLETGSRKRLTRPDDRIIGDLDPRFSPDGRTISFVRAFHRAHQELFMVPVAGGEPVQITSDGKQVSGQDWTPDGRSLVFGSNRSGEFRLWRTSFPSGKRPSLRQTAIYGDSPMQLSLARHAPALVYAVLREDLHIWRLDLSVDPHGPDSWKRVIASSGQDVSPQYSPQGDKIAFRSDRSGEEQLWICDSDGGNPVQVTRGRVRPSVGRWSPDGQSIVFNDAGSGEILLAHSGADGAWSLRALGANGYHPVFSPDGKWIYAGTSTSITRMPAQGGPAAAIAQIRGISLGISGDGRYLYFVRDPAGTTLWRIRTLGGQPEKVIEGLIPYCSSCWALSASGIHYLGVKPGSPDQQVLYFRDLATGRSRPIEDYPETLSPIGSGPFALSPDGRYLLCVRVQLGDADVFRVEPFR